MTIQEAMKQATVELMEEKGFHEVMEINEHDCFNWAFKVFNLLPGSAIGGHRIDGEGQSYIILPGICYDAETPDGVACWWNLVIPQNDVSDNVSLVAQGSNLKVLVHPIRLSVQRGWLFPVDVMVSREANRSQRQPGRVNVPNPSSQTSFKDRDRVLFDPKKFKALLPAEMLKERRFVRYFLKPKPEGGTAKIPLGNHSDPNTWSTFDECVAALENKEQGIGYNFLGGDVHGLDIDHCRNPRTGQICPEAMLVLSRIPSWAEYSVSGCGLHVFFKGQVRGKQLTETCIQYWNPKNSPRFFALTCDMVGDAFKELKDIGEDFNYIFATARHISAKIRSELKTIDPEQWAALPAERVVAEEPTQDKSKTKSRVLHKDFDLEHFLKFYELPVDNVANKISVSAIS
jgi:hypothetical protein